MIYKDGPMNPKIMILKKYTMFVNKDENIFHIYIIFILFLFDHAQNTPLNCIALDCCYAFLKWL